MPTNKSMTALRLGSLSTTLGSSVRLGEKSGCLFLAGYLPLFLGVPALAAAFFSDLGFGAILEVDNEKKMSADLEILP